jgi:NAD(P)-dependent dehydrogenase (short-subunit alcohol dehydrogenase family)
MLSSLDLDGRVAVVIGGTSGLGRAIAHSLAKGGADTVACGRRAQLVDEVAGEIEKIGRRTIRQDVDVLSRESIDQLRDKVLEAFGHVDILVNAAARIMRIKTKDMPEAEWHSTLDTNVGGILRACQSFYEPLAGSGRGRIINIASLGSFVGLKEVAAYSASKAALLSLTRSLALEWAPQQVCVNAIAPGVFRTDMNKKLLDNTARGREYLIRTPMGRFGTAEELGGAAVLLASDAASFITGQCIIVDGGFLASGVNS